MLSISHIFIIIFSLSALALILAIIEWFHLSSLSNLNMNFEREIEKKSQEFDAFRKDWSVQQQNHTVYTYPSISMEPSIPSDNPNQIQIMRNVGGTFKDTSQISIKSFSVDQISQPQNNPKQFNYSLNSQNNSKWFPSIGLNNSQYDSEIPHIHSDDQSIGHTQPATRQNMPIHNADQKNYQHNNLYKNHQEFSDPNTQIHQNREGPLTNLSPSLRRITLYLYSDTVRDADFNGLWKNLTEQLSSGCPLAITIDLSGVNFIYEKEIGYLQKFCKYIEQLSGTLALAHCNNEIVKLLKSHPQLYTKISI